MKVSITSNVQDVTRYLTNLSEKQIRFSSALALTRIAKIAKDDLKKEFKRRFDKPTPYTLRSIFISTANKRDLVAVVGIKDQESSKNNKSPAQLLRHEFKGGSRGRSRLEYWLSQAGLISSTEYLAPGQEAKLDRYGNMSRGQVQQVISQLKIGGDASTFASNSARSKRKRGRKKGSKSHGFFWSRGERLPRGVWLRDGGDAVPIAIVIRKPRYHAAVDVLRTIKRTVARVGVREIEKAVDFAIRTAR